MKNPAVGVLSALIDLLDGNLSYQGQNIPVYTSVPASVGPSYVYISSFRFVEDLTKEYFGGEVRFDIRVVFRQPKGQVSKLPVHEVSGELMDLLKPTRTTRIPFNDGLLNLHALVEDVLDYEEYNDDEVDVSNLISMRFIYQEVSEPVTNDFLLAETGSFLLAETGSKIKI